MMINNSPRQEFSYLTMSAVAGVVLVFAVTLSVFYALLVERTNDSQRNGIAEPQLEQFESKADTDRILHTLSAPSGSFNEPSFQEPAREEVSSEGSLVESSANDNEAASEEFPSDEESTTENDAIIQALSAPSE